MARPDSLRAELMCGIAGVIHPELNQAVAAVAAATAAQAARGPDDHGAEISACRLGAVGLGHRRLSILDLSPAGHQPMRHTPSGAAIVFNGEIYNYRQLRAELQKEGEEFRSSGDTEVLLAGLARHGAAFLPRLEGMYAFAFFDPRGPSLLLGRDPAGIKPLYLAETADAFVFASEVRAILATGLVRPVLEPRAVAGYLAYGAVQHPLTLFRGVTSLPPGAHLTLRPATGGAWEKVGPTPFWRLPRSRAQLTAAESLEGVRATLDQAVRDHLQADVPVGLFLSSGLDSTILAGLARTHAPGLRSFTVTCADQTDFSEQHLAARTAQQFGLEHTEIPLPLAEAEADVMHWLRALDQPSIDGLNVFIISRVVRQRGIKVALSGLGADELFGGYPSFREVPRLRRVLRLVRSLPVALRQGLARLAAVGRHTTFRAKLCDMLGGDGSLRALYLQRRRAMSDPQLARLGIQAAALDLGPDFLPPAAAPDIDPDERDPVRVLSQLEFRLYQGNMLLRDADANGMASGLEIRVPFLDQRLLDLAHAIPGPVRLPAGAAGKHLLRTAFAPLLRPEILLQHKRGFVLPIRRWLAGPLRPWCERALAAVKDTGQLRPAGVDAVWQQFLAEPESPAWSRAFALAVLGEFLHRH
jgi:asparagine synthase (glutamine-hydrolysing)